MQTIQTNLEFRQKRKKRIRTIVYQDKHKSQEVEEELLAQTSAMSAELEQVKHDEEVMIVMNNVSHNDV